MIVAANIICIYLMINNITGQMYIGQTIRFKERMDEHFRGANADTQDIDKACLEYGREAFTIEKLEVFDEYDKDVLDDAEEFYIAAYNTFKDDFHYNLTPGGGGAGAGEDHPCYRHDLDNDVLRDEYVNQELSCREIARRHNTTLDTILRRLNKLGIDTSQNGNPYRDDLDDDVLRDEYVNQGLSCREIARRHNTGLTTIRRRLNNLGVDTSRDYSAPRDDLDDDVLRDEYVNQELSCREIARRHNITPQTVRYRLNNLGIDTSRNAPKNTTGYYRVCKAKDSKCKQGFTYIYKYPDNNGKRKSIRSVDIKKLEVKVKEKGLTWRKL